MADMIRAILGKNAKRRKPTPPPAQARRALPEGTWAAAPAAPAAPAATEREAVRQRWQPPPKAEADTIRALWSIPSDAP